MARDCVGTSRGQQAGVETNIQSHGVPGAVCMREASQRLMARDCAEQGFNKYSGMNEAGCTSLCAEERAEARSRA
eukprot:scaffold45324_cov20-Tisochrysis_lutea.AAC.5